MQRLIDWFTWLLSDRRSPFQLVLWTLLAAYYVPQFVVVVMFLLGLIPYYFWTLFTHPSWLHLYFGVIFAGVVVSLWYRGDKSEPPSVRRGRRVLEPSSFATTKSRSPASRTRSSSKIRRGR